MINLIFIIKAIWNDKSEVTSQINSQIGAYDNKNRKSVRQVKKSANRVIINEDEEIMEEDDEDFDTKLKPKSKTQSIKLLKTFNSKIQIDTTKYSNKNTNNNFDYNDYELNNKTNNLNLNNNDNDNISFKNLNNNADNINNANNSIFNFKKPSIFDHSEKDDNINKLNTKLKLKVSIPKVTTTPVINKDTYEKSINQVKTIISSTNQDYSTNPVLQDLIKQNNYNNNNNNAFPNKSIFPQNILHNNNFKKEPIFQNTAFSPISPGMNFFKAISPFQNSIGGTPNNQICFNFHNQNFYNTYYNGIHNGSNSKESNPAINVNNQNPIMFLNNDNNADNSISNLNNSGSGIFNIPQPQPSKTSDANIFPFFSQASPGNNQQNNGNNQFSYQSYNISTSNMYNKSNNANCTESINKNN